MPASRAAASFQFTRAALRGSGSFPALRPLWYHIMARFSLIKLHLFFHFISLTLVSPVFFSVNTQPPALHINGSLLVPLDGFAPLSPSQLQVKDLDSPTEQLIFQLVQSPSNGQLLLFRGGDGDETGGQEMKPRELIRDDTFTWADLRTGRVGLRHQKDKARSVGVMLGY